MSVLERLENIETLFAVQKRKYRETLYVTDSIPANSSKLAKVNTSNVGDFLIMYITGNYTTLYHDGTNVVDNGVCSLSAKLQDGNSQTLLFNDYIDLSLWLSPGRTKSILDSAVYSTALGGAFLNPMEFEYLIARNSDIIIDVKNSANTINVYKIAFHGFRYR